MTFRLLYPWFLAGLAAVVLVWWAWLSPRRRPALRFPSLAMFRVERPTWSLRARHLLPVLRSLTIILLVLAMVRPQAADEQTRVTTEGIALQLVLDRSGSMSATDFSDDRGRPQTRLDAVKEVVQAFVRGDGEKMKGRPDDLVGLIVFAHYADTECPLTRDHAHVIRALHRVDFPQTRDEDGTAIGDAMMLALERLRNIGRRMGEEAGFQIKSRVMVVLTDGMQNRGRFNPLEAAEAAAALGVKVYAIGAAPEFAEHSVGGLLLQPRTVRVPVDIDEDTLRKVAETTGGRYFRARDAASLAEVYAEIDKMERSVIDETRFETWRELATEWHDLGSLRLPPPLLAALVLLAAEAALASTRFRRIP